MGFGAPDFGVLGSWFGVWGLGVWGLGVWGLVFGGFGVWGLRFGVSGSEFRVQDVGSRTGESVGFRWDLGSRVEQGCRV